MTSGVYSGGDKVDTSSKYFTWEHGRWEIPLENPSQHLIIVLLYGQDVPDWPFFVFVVLLRVTIQNNPYLLNRNVVKFSVNQNLFMVALITFSNILANRESFTRVTYSQFPIPVFFSSYQCRKVFQFHFNFRPNKKLAPYGDWRSTSARAFGSLWPWPWPWIRVKVIPLCISHRVLPVY